MERTYIITEAEIHNIISETVQTLMEDGEGAGGFGGGALGGSNLMVGSSDESGGVAYPAFGGGKKKSVIDRGSVYTPRNSSGKISTVDMSDGTARHNGKGGSISIPKERG